MKSDGDFWRPYAGLGGNLEEIETLNTKFGSAYVQCNSELEVAKILQGLASTLRVPFQ